MPPPVDGSSPLSGVTVVTSALVDEPVLSPPLLARPERSAP
jgi:hypothetical protein